MEENKNGHPEGCRCMFCNGWRGGHCGFCCGGRHGLVRIILCLLLLLVVFWAGVKVGEFKSVYWDFGGGHYMRSMMWGGSGSNAGYYPMMGGWYNWPQATSTAK